MLLRDASIPPGRREAGQLPPYPTYKARTALTSLFARTSAPISSSSRATSRCALLQAECRAVCPCYSQMHQYPQEEEQQVSYHHRSPLLHNADSTHLFLSRCICPLLQQQLHNIVASLLRCPMESRDPCLLPDASIPPGRRFAGQLPPYPTYKARTALTSSLAWTSVPISSSSRTTSACPS
jgi:hypothetical protein